MSAEILALPVALRTVPELKAEFEPWRDKVLQYRIAVRRLADGDPVARKDIVATAADDPAYDFLVFGATFEPRDRVGRLKGWYPLIPYAFQVDLIRWYQRIMSVLPGMPEAMLGRGDGLCEKARGMTFTQTMACLAGHGWKYDDGFVFGFLSYKEDLVEKHNDTGTIFHKVEGYLGLDIRVPDSRVMLVDGNMVPVPVRSPAWMVPEGYESKRHNQQLALGHPTRTNAIVGMTTTEKAGTGTRLTGMCWDEAGKFLDFSGSWQGAGAVTDHRIAGSSADTRYGTGFRDLARHSEQAQRTGTAGPSFIRLRAERHPEQTDIWREEMEARHTGVPGAAEAMAREFDLDYEAGGTRYIYMNYIKDNDPKPLTFQPAHQTLDFCIDPGIRDMTAFHVISYDMGKDEYGLLLSYANSEKPADFYATLVTGTPTPNLFEYGDEEQQVMEFFQQHGRRIRFWVGDPAGKNRGGGRATSFYDEFSDATYALTDGRSRVNIWSSNKADYKLTKGRIDALRLLLPKMVFNNTPPVLRTLAALKDYHWAAIEYDRQSTSFPSNPVHGWGSDLVAAMEYYAAHRRIGTVADLTPRTKPFILSATGRPWDERKRTRPR